MAEWAQAEAVAEWGLQELGGIIAAEVLEVTEFLPRYRVHYNTMALVVEAIALSVVMELVVTGVLMDQAMMQSSTAVPAVVPETGTTTMVV
jgi:hypothetical protein